MTEIIHALSTLAGKLYNLLLYAYGQALTALMWIGKHPQEVFIGITIIVIILIIAMIIQNHRNYNRY